MALKADHQTTYFKLKLLALVAIITGIGLFACSKIVTELTNNDLNETNQSVVHTKEVLILSNEIKVQVQGMQNNSRGFLLSSDHDFLNGAHVHYKHAQEAITSLISLIHNNTNQVEKLRMLQNDLLNYKNYQESLFKLALNGQIDAAITEFKTFRGKGLVDEIMQNVEEIEAYENQILLGRTSKSQKLFTLLDQLNLAASLLASGVLFLSFIFIFRALSKRENQENKLLEDLNLKEHLLLEIPFVLLILDTQGKLNFLNNQAKKTLLPFGEKEISKVMDIEFILKEIKQSQTTSLSTLIKPALKGIRVDIDSLSLADYPDQELHLFAEPVKGIQNGSDFIIVVIQNKAQK